MSKNYHSQLLKVNYNKRFFIGVSLNLTMVFIQIFYGIQANSVALISDALHNAGDVLGLLIAWGGFYFSTLRPRARFTFGFKNTTIIAAFLNAVLLFMAVGGITWEALKRIGAPEAINPEIIIAVAVFAVLINSLSAIMFLGGREDLNIRGAFIHLVSDAAVSLSVIVVGLVILFWQWYWLDPLLSIGISLVILLTSWRLAKESFGLILQAAPLGINMDSVSSYLTSQKNVVAIHDLHIWALSTREAALSVHLVTSSFDGYPGFISKISKGLQDVFHISHCTIQVEDPEIAKDCPSCGDIPPKS